MSFSSDIKEKLCKIEYMCQNCAAAELAGALAFGGSLNENLLKFTTENENAAKRISKAISDYFGIDAPIKTSSKVNRIIIDDIYKTENKFIT